MLFKTKTFSYEGQGGAVSPNIFMFSKNLKVADSFGRRFLSSSTEPEVMSSSSSKETFSRAALNSKRVQNVKRIR